MNNQIYNQFKRVAANKITTLSQFSTTLVSDANDRSRALDIQFSVYNHQPLIGNAYTIDLTAGNNLLVYYALNHAQPGDVLVIAGGGFTTRATLGAIIATNAQARHLGGIVVDGAVRDVADLKQLTMPIFAKGVSANGPLKKGDGSINMPVAIGGQIVNPGDVVMGDADGVVIIPANAVETTIQKVTAVAEMEAGKFRQIEEKQKLPTAWLMTALDAQNYQVMN